MTERERLIELIEAGTRIAYDRSLEDVKRIVKENHHFNSATDRTVSVSEMVADFLLENGVIMPPVSLGDKIYEIISPKDREPYFITATVCAVHIADGSRNSCQHKRESYIVAECSGTKYVHKYPISKFGKSVFLTREEAEKALKESEENA